MNNFKDYVVEIIDQDHVLLSYDLLTEVYELSLVDIKEKFGEVSVGSNILAIKYPDADLDDGDLVDCSTYSLKIGELFISENQDDLSTEIWDYISNLLEYKKRYLSY